MPPARIVPHRPEILLAMSQLAWLISRHWGGQYKFYLPSSLPPSLLLSNRELASLWSSHISTVEGEGLSDVGPSPGVLLAKVLHGFGVLD